MLIPLLLAVVQTASADTLPTLEIALHGEPLVAATYRAEVPLLPGVVLLGEPIEAPTYMAEDPRVPQRIPFSVYASMPLPNDGIPGMPAHLLEPLTDVGFTRAELDRALSTIESEVERGAFPGATLAVGRWDSPVLEQGIGTLDRGFGSPPVDPDHTIYDLASLTKVVATTTAVMLLYEDGVLDLDAPVSRYLPTYVGGGREWVTIRHLLTHSSGLPAWTETYAPTPEASLQRALTTPLVAQPGEKVEYSDVGFVVLWAAAEAAYQGSLPELLDRRIFTPLEMWYTSFKPGEGCLRCAPTEEIAGYRGIVHDPDRTAARGITGNAGLFSTAHDLSRFAAMLVNGGQLDGVRVLERSTIERFTERQPGARTRALGWDTPDDGGGGAGGLRISRGSFGHTGFTGTSLWVDPARGTWVVLLSNRTYRPTGPNRMQALRRELNDRIATSVDQGVYIAR